MSHVLGHVPYLGFTSHMPGHVGSHGHVPLWGLQGHVSVLTITCRDEHSSSQGVAWDAMMTRPPNAPPWNPSPRIDLAGPGLSPEEASANGAKRIARQLATAGIPLPTLQELTPAEHDTHYAETQRHFNMGPGSGTTWESVVEVEYFVEGERLANPPNGYFHPSMSIIR
jgi:hypothetical protein